MHDARGIANFLLDEAERRGIRLTVMTLLKVLYFAHAWYLAKENRPLIAQPFEAWKYGPVSRVVYDQFKIFEKSPISGRALSLNVDSAKFEPTRYEFDSDTREFLLATFNYYSQFHAFKLSDLTHEEGGPWDQIWKEAERRAVPGMIIPNALIRTWFV